MHKPLKISSDDIYITDLFAQAQAGVASAQFTLGMLYLIDQDWLQKDEAKGITLIQEAAQKNVASAQAILGVAYEDGMFGLEQNDDEAERLFRLAAKVDEDYAIQRLAERGDIHAQYQYGTKCLYGLGVDKDIKTAFVYLKLSFMQGNKIAKTQLDIAQEKLLAYITQRSLCKLFVELSEIFMPEEIFDLLNKLDLSKISENRKMEKEYDQLSKVLTQSENLECKKMANTIMRLNDLSNNRQYFFAPKDEVEPLKSFFPELEKTGSRELQ